MREESLSSPPTYTRREILRVSLKAAGVVATSFLLGSCVETNPHLPSTPTPEGNHKTLRENIQRKYGIVLTTLTEESTGGDAKEFTTREINWQTLQLKMLDSFLSALPPHFYGQARFMGGDGLPLRISLGEISVYDIGKITKYPHRVELDHKTFSPGDPYKAFTDLTHELAHSAVPLDPDWPPYPLSDANYREFKFKHSPWYPEILSILGKDPKEFEDVRKKISQKMDDVPAKAFTSSGGENWTRNPLFRKMKSYSQVRYGLGGWGGNAEEFLAAMAEQYIQGRTHFIEIYSEFFSADIAKKLYDFSKEKVFIGKEYQAGEIDGIIRPFIAN